MNARLGSKELAATVKAGDWILSDWDPLTRDVPYQIRRIVPSNSESNRMMDIPYFPLLDTRWARKIVAAPE